MMTNWLLKKLFKAELKKLFLRDGDVVVLTGETKEQLQAVSKMLESQILPYGVAAIGLTSDVTIEKLQNIPEEIKDMLRKIL